jgi:hypothetical protein
MSCGPLADLATIAENYGQMTGVLAGFAFTALVLLLTPGIGARRNSGAPLCLLSAFVTLIMTTLLYSLLAGEDAQEARARAATVELIDGLVFGLAVITLLQGVTLLMRDANIELAAVSAGRFMTVVAFPTLSLYFVAQGAADTAGVRAALHGQGCLAPISDLGVALTVALATVLSASLSPRARSVLSAYAARCRVWAPLVVLGATTVAGLVSGDLATRPPTLLMSPRALDLFLVASAALLALVGLMFSAASVNHAPTEDRSLVERPSAAMTDA